jgi:hypothetical protein
MPNGFFPDCIIKVEKLKTTRKQKLVKYLRTCCHPVVKRTGYFPENLHYEVLNK